MGLFSFIGDMETAKKLSDQYGMGASQAFLDLRAQQTSESEASNIHDYAKDEYDLKMANKEMQFKMANYLRTTDVQYSETEKEQLNSIIKQFEYVYDQESGDSLVKEWNDTCFEKEFNYYVSTCIKDLENKLITYLYDDKEFGFTEFKEKYLREEFERIYSSPNHDKYIENLDKLLAYLQSNYDIQLGDETLEPIKDTIKTVGKDWNQKIQWR